MEGGSLDYGGRGPLRLWREGTPWTVDGGGPWTRVGDAGEGAERGHCDPRTGGERSPSRQGPRVAWGPERFQTKADTSRPPRREEEYLTLSFPCGYGQ